MLSLPNFYFVSGAYLLSEVESQFHRATDFNRCIISEHFPGVLAGACVYEHQVPVERGNGRCDRECLEAGGHVNDCLGFGIFFRQSLFMTNCLHLKILSKPPVHRRPTWRNLLG